jgi:uridine kinase
VTTATARPAAHDLESDRSLTPRWRTAPRNAVLLVDGLFLHRAELAGYWDLSILLDVPFEVTAARMAQRDGTHPDPQHPSMRRYVGAQLIYSLECRPCERASIVIDNTDPMTPRIVST